MATSNSNIVVEWLRSLHLGQYSESFLDNGYDDLEICKQVGDPDLDAIGVFNPSHRNRLLQSVRTLREEGAASVYFTLEESAAIHEECLCDNSSVRSSRTSSNHCSSDKELLGAQCASGSQRGNASPAASSSNGSAQELGKYLDEYEEGKAELVKIPRLQLKMLLKDRMMHDGIRLSCKPYSTSSGERGYLEGLSSRYADLFNTHYGDVLEHLEDLRRREWEDMSPRIRVLVGTTPTTPPSGGYSPCGAMGVGQHSPQGYHGLTTSLSQPIYVPGKYSPSSCLSDKEEDEIYGCGYGVFGKQMLQRQQQQHQIITPQANYQSCLSPRSAYFYEFPPNGEHGCQGGKKKTSFSRFLRGLKTATGHRKDKHGNSPRHLRSNRVGTPDSLGGGDHGNAPAPCDPRDYERPRYNASTNGTPNDFEATIQRLKVQEVMKKRERFHKEHEEILRDIRHGLLQIGRDARHGTDDTYMYDEDARYAAGSHWYDEPPFESDPEDFLMDITGQPPSAATAARNSRVCFTLNLRPEPRAQAVISLRTAGDISLPAAAIGCARADAWTARGLTARGSARRGLLVSQHGGQPATLIDRGSGDYASDVLSIGSRLSTMSTETTRSEQVETVSVHSPSHASGNKSRPFRKVSGFKCRNSASSEPVSASQSSDYEDQEEAESAARHEADRSRRSRHRQQDPLAGSVESLPSGSGSSTQALVPTGSTHSSVSPDDLSPLAPSCIIGRARALVDYQSPYDKEALRFKKGDVIEVLTMNASGLWKGVCHGRVGSFKFVNVEMLPERLPSRHRGLQHGQGRPANVEELLKKINLEEHISVFVLNGYEDLELFKELEEADLKYLGVSSPEHLAKLLTAIELLRDLDTGSDEDRCSTSEDEMRGRPAPSPSFRRLHFPRDSGCYDASTRHHRRPPPADFPNNLDGRPPRPRREAPPPPATPSKGVDAELAPNIPVGAEGAVKDKPSMPRPLDSYAIARGTSVSVEPCRRANEDRCEADSKMTAVKFVAGNGEAEVQVVTGRGCLSEKSSDSGVSSSSLSSSNHRDARKILAPSVVESPTGGGGFVNFGCIANRSSPVGKECV